MISGFHQSFHSLNKSGDVGRVSLPVVRKYGGFCFASPALRRRDQTESGEFKISPKARRRYLVSLDRNLLLRLQPLARMRGLSIESIVNLPIEQRKIERGYPKLVARLEQSGITVVSLQPETVDDMYVYWEILGTLTGPGPRNDTEIQGEN